MIKFSDLKIGDYVLCSYEGKTWEGEVTGLNGDEKQVCVETSVQEFWYDPEDLSPLPLSDEQLLRLNFSKETFDDGAVKYKKGAFRIVVPHKDDFANMEMWYREDRRHHPAIQYVHQLQNHYLEMTKVHLTAEPV